MVKCLACGIPTENGIKAMWNTVKGYKPQKGYMISDKPIVVTMIPILQPHQGFLCVACMRKFSAYPIQSFSDMSSSQKKKTPRREKQSTFDW
jgi:hypothetical protein